MKKPSSTPNNSRPQKLLTHRLSSKVRSAITGAMLLLGAEGLQAQALPPGQVVLKSHFDKAETGRQKAVERNAAFDKRIRGFLESSQPIITELQKIYPGIEYDGASPEKFFDTVETKIKEDGIIKKSVHEKELTEKGVALIAVVENQIKKMQESGIDITNIQRDASGMPTNLTEIYQQLAQKIDAQKTEITNGGFSTAEIALGLILAMGMSLGMGFGLGFVAGIRHKKKQSLTDIPSDEEPVPEVTSSLIHVPADAMEVLPSEITRQGDTYLYTVTFDVSEPFTMNIIRNMDLETAKKILKIGPVWADIQFDETGALEIARTKVGVWNESIYNFLNENGLEYGSLQKTKIQSIACKRIDEKLEILELETDQEMGIMAMRPAKLEYLNAPNLRSSLRFSDSFPRLTHVQIKDQPKAEVVISHIPTLGKVLSLEQTIIGYTPTLEWDGAQLVPIPLPLVAIDETNKSQYGYYEGQMVKLGDKNIGGLLTLGAFSLDEWPKPTDKPQALDGPGVPDERVQAAFRSPAEAPGVPKEVVGVINELNETTLREIYNIYATQKIGFDGNSCHRIEFAPNMTDFSSLDLAQLKTEEYGLFTFVFPNPDATLPDLRQFNGEKVLVLQIPYERWKLLKGETEAGKEANDAIKKTIYPDDVLSDKIMFNIIPRV